MADKKRRKIEIVFKTVNPRDLHGLEEQKTIKWIGCNEPKAGDLLLIDMVYRQAYENVLNTYDLQIGELVRPTSFGLIDKAATINGWYKLTAKEKPSAKKKA